METSSVFESNPWDNEETSLGALKRVISLAHNSGHLPLNEEIQRQEVLTDAEERFPSLQVITVMKEIDSQRQQLKKVNLEIQKRLLDKETKDITHQDVLEKRIEDLNQLNSHLQSVIDQKDQLIGKLQQPYVGDFLRIEANYKKYVSEVFPQLVPILSELNSELENIKWVGKVDVLDGQLECILSEISSSLATLQSGYQSVCQRRDTVAHLHSQRTYSNCSDHST